MPVNGWFRIIFKSAVLEVQGGVSTRPQGSYKFGQFTGWKRLSPHSTVQPVIPVLPLALSSALFCSPLSGPSPNSFSVTNSRCFPIVTLPSHTEGMYVCVCVWVFVFDLGCVSVRWLVLFSVRVGGWFWSNYSPEREGLVHVLLLTCPAQRHSNYRVEYCQQIWICHYFLTPPVKNTLFFHLHLIL